MVVGLRLERYSIVVEQYYNQILGRSSDALRAFWITGLVNGTLSQGDVAIGFVTSLEYTTSHPTSTQYVQGLYTNLLGRAPGTTSQAEINFQVRALDTGLTTRGLMAFSFLASDEAAYVTGETIAADGGGSIVRRMGAATEGKRPGLPDPPA